MYSAVVLSELHQFKLKDKFLEFLRIYDFKNRKLVQDWKFICHHMTMNYGEIPQEDFNLRGLTVNLSVESYGFYNDSVCAVKVGFGSNYSSNEIPHITIAHNELGKPVMSNSITEWHDFPKLELLGKIQIIE